MADKLALYETSVQMPDHEVAFFEQAYRDVRQRKPLSLCEDFCGTFAVSCQWVRSNENRTAIGIDTCETTLQWGRAHNLSRLSDEQQKRITLLQQDVRNAISQRVDILAAQNFSFYFFRTRGELIDYFRKAITKLTDDGIMVIDMMGGAECRIEGLSHTQSIGEGKDGFKYQWKQVSYNPITSDACCSISFSFPDGSRIRDAFVYHWRLWGIAEVREILAEVGFSETHVYWAIDDEFDSDRDGGWERRHSAPSDASWTCYLVAVR
ncbi:MAG: class I SAM-dependent methyltransferase [Pirellulaceae bacterium]|nr:class I SAM-dependent methyltransferase [Pirellulaceae bacterium]